MGAGVVLLLMFGGLLVNTVLGLIRGVLAVTGATVFALTNPRAAGCIAGCTLCRALQHGAVLGIFTLTIATWIIHQHWIPTPAVIAIIAGALTLVPVLDHLIYQPLARRLPRYVEYV